MATLNPHHSHDLKCVVDSIAPGFDIPDPEAFLRDLALAPEDDAEELAAKSIMASSEDWMLEIERAADAQKRNSKSCHQLEGHDLLSFLPCGPSPSSTLETPGVDWSLMVDTIHRFRESPHDTDAQDLLTWSVKKVLSKHSFRKDGVSKHCGDEKIQDDQYQRHCPKETKRGTKNENEVPARRNSRRFFKSHFFEGVTCNKNKKSMKPEENTQRTGIEVDNKGSDAEPAERRKKEKTHHKQDGVYVECDSGWGRYEHSLFDGQETKMSVIPAITHAELVPSKTISRSHFLEKKHETSTVFGPRVTTGIFPKGLHSRSKIRKLSRCKQPWPKTFRGRRLKTLHGLSRKAELCWTGNKARTHKAAAHHEDGRDGLISAPFIPVFPRTTTPILPPATKRKVLCDATAHVPKGHLRAELPSSSQEFLQEEAELPEPGKAQRLWMTRNLWAIVELVHYSIIACMTIITYLSWKIKRDGSSLFWTNTTKTTVSLDLDASWALSRGEMVLRQ